MALKVAIRVDGNRHIGLGHMFRMLHLAEHLTGDAGAEVRFLVLQSSLDSEVARFLHEAGLHIDVVSRPGDPWQEDRELLQRALQAQNSDVVIVDIIQPDLEDDDLNLNQEFRPVGPEPTIEAIQGLDVTTVLVSDRFDRYAPDVDLLVNSCPAQKYSWYQGLERPRMLLGTDAYILAPSMTALATAPRPPGHTPPRLAVFFGGNDHRGFLQRVLPELLERTGEAEIEAALGAATPNAEEIARDLSRQGLTAHCRLPDMGPFLLRADLALVTCGNTLFDLAALGTPSLALATRPRQRVTAEFLQNRGCCRFLGLHDQEYLPALRDALDTLLHAPALLGKMSRRGKETVSPHGALTIIDTITLVHRDRSHAT